MDSGYGTPAGYVGRVRVGPGPGLGWCTRL